MVSPGKINLELNFANSLIKLHLDNTDRSIISHWLAGRHCNAEYEAHILLTGSCLLDVEDETLPLHTSDIIIIAPGRFHYPHNISSEFLRFSFSFQPHTPELAAQLSSMIETAAHFTLPQSMISLCHGILEEATSASAFRKDALTSMFTLLLVNLFRNLDLEDQTNPAAVSSANSRMSIIDSFFSPWPNSNNFGTEAELAERLGLSLRQLNRILTQTYGMNFRQKMLDSRMAYASMLLSRSEKSVGEIAETVGYTAESSFYKAFNRYYHMSPSEYRKQCSL